MTFICHLKDSFCFVSTNQRQTLLFTFPVASLYLSRHFNYRYLTLSLIHFILFLSKNKIDVPIRDRVVKQRVSVYFRKSPSTPGSIHTNNCLDCYYFLGSLNRIGVFIVLKLTVVIVFV